MSEEQPGVRPSPLVLIVTGMSGAGRTTAINALEDLGYEALNNFPLGLIDALIEPVTGTSHPIAIGLQTRTRGFSTRAVTDALDRLRGRWRAGALMLFLDCADPVLVSRFSQTRRRHPLAPAEDAATGVARERAILADVLARADAVIDTTELTPHDLKRALETRFALATTQGLAVTVQSFAYKRGTPHDADMVFDCRFLRNPYWETALRELDGRDPQIQGFVAQDPLWSGFFERLGDLVLMLLPAYKAEGRAYLSLGLGCTGGQHRSVAVAEALARHLGAAGWPVSVRHRELERPGGGG